MSFKILSKYSFIFVLFILLGLFGCDNSGGSNNDTILTSNSSFTPVFAPPEGTGNPGTIFTPPTNATILSIVPSSGPPDVSTFVTITGTGFLTNTLVTFAGNPATNITVIDANTLTCNTPTGTANVSVDVGVQNLGSSPGVLPNGFTYVFVANSITPTSGTTAGGTAVTITGDGFASGAQVFFGVGNAATSVVVVDTNTITCTTPPSATPGSVDVIVQNTQSEQAILLAGFIYAGFVVTNNLDSGPGSLRQAILDATLSVGSDSIGFNLDPTELTIILTSGELTISDEVIIVGLGARILTITGGDASRIFNVTASGILNLSGITFRDGLSPGVAPAGGAILNLGEVNALNCAFLDNVSVITGGAILNSGGVLDISNCTFSGNMSSDSGGAIAQDTSGTTTLVNSTFSGNSGFFGGAIRAFSGTLSISSCTMTGNASTSGGGGGVHTTAGVPAVVDNTIIAENTSTAVSTSQNIVGVYTSLGYNFVGDGTGGSGFTGTGDQVGTFASPIDPLLGPLQDNGGPTDTHALLTGSSAIDAGDPSSTLLEDQRGLPRPVNVVIDIGAVEEQ